MTEWLAADYHEQSSLQQVMAEESLAALTLARDERILDIGCGDGKVTAAIASRVPAGSVVGVDPSRDMVDFASKRFGPPEHSNLRFEVGDARRLPFRDEFDLAVSFNALHWVAEQSAALGSIHAALRPGGRAVLRFVCKGDRPSLEDVIEQVRQEPRWAAAFTEFQQPYAHFTPDAYGDMATAAGFRVDALRVSDRTWDFQTRDAFAAFARATFVFWTSRLPEPQWRPFIAAVLDRYQLVASLSPRSLQAFKFYQLEVTLTRAKSPVATIRPTA